MKRLAAKLWNGRWVIGPSALFLAAVLFWPKPPYNPRVLEKLSCVAASVALKQHLFDRWQTQQPIPPDITATFEDRFNRLQRYTRSLRMSDDRHIQAFRPIMIKAEAARDEAVSNDPDAYMTAAWAEVQACDDTLFQVAGA